MQRNYAKPGEILCARYGVYYGKQQYMINILLYFIFLICYFGEKNEIYKAV